MAPVVCAIAGRILYHANADSSELACAPGRDATLAGMLRRYDPVPINDLEWNACHLHADTPRQMMPTNYGVVIRFGYIVTRAYRDASRYFAHASRSVFVESFFARS